MSEQVRVSNAFYLNGEALERVRQALQVARQQARLLGRRAMDAT